jgi:predicted ATPase
VLKGKEVAKKLDEWFEKKDKLVFENFRPLQAKIIFFGKTTLKSCSTMIKKIEIKNFKSIPQLELELGRINIFIGANGSGKSNILEGITMGAAALAGKLDHEFLSTRIRMTNADLMTSAFELPKKNQVIDFKITNEKKDHIDFEIVHYNKKWLTNYSTEIMYKKYGHLTRPEIIKIWRESEFQVTEFIQTNHMSDFLIFAPENHFLRNFNEESQIRPIGVRGEGLFSHIVELRKEKPEILTKISEHLRLLDWFDGFEIPNDLMFTEKRIRIKDNYLEDGISYFDQRSANEGFLYLLFYFTLFISDETPNFFAIDNIDNAMNPKLGRRLIKTLAQLAKEHDKQAIFTTHNPAILDGLNLFDDEQRLFMIFRDGDGHTQANRIFKKEDANMPLSEMFLRGYLGGLPNHF